ncbi:hypothetical protein J7T55_001246 [Diaporthe amygdali]|uniref:uncharacterized protein n=1 Tax=Phomopsis amygdali TaxID=1214568 RepID=UPI0022FEB662|nr:uncharacterized protein J7T55_001246 [Diaporthe amygdali]KAJ0103876.1 hypothetical protein J7T55_001246 [Diaporthe amygdali]
MAAPPVQLDYKVINPPGTVRHSHTVIMLHDNEEDADALGSDFFELRCSPGNDFHPRRLVNVLDCFRWVFPHAPFQIGNQATVRRWFTIPNPLQQQDSPALDDPHELEVSIDGILNLIRNEQKSVRRHQIYIGGHGQGFAVAAAAFLVDGEGDFAGLFGLNGWLPHVSMIQGGSPDNFWRWVSNARALLHPTRFGSLFTRPYPSDDHDIVVPPPSVDHNCGIVQRRTTLGRRRTPIFLAHPHYDSVVDCASSAAASDAFDRMGWVGAGFEDYPHDNGETQSPAATTLAVDT